MQQEVTINNNTIFFAIRTLFNQNTNFIVLFNETAITLDHMIVHQYIWRGSTHFHVPLLLPGGNLTTT
jgi:hypothetical protein